MTFHKSTQRKWWVSYNVSANPWAFPINYCKRQLDGHEKARSAYWASPYGRHPPHVRLLFPSTFTALNLKRPDSSGLKLKVQSLWNYHGRWGGKAKERGLFSLCDRPCKHIYGLLSSPAPEPLGRRLAQSQELRRQTSGRIVEFCWRVYSLKARGQPDKSSKE